MDIEQNLVIIKGKDKTEEFIRYESKGYLINVYYKNAEMAYPCARTCFEFYRNPKELDIEENIVIVDGCCVYNLVKILDFQKYYRLFFLDGTSKVVSADRLEILDKSATNIRSADKFQYLKDISEIVSIKTEEGASLLTKEYKKINFIENDTALYQYLNPHNYKNQNNKNLGVTIYPFGTNKSQFDAVKKAMENQISIIEGPPGTGKTQTILNIIANIVKNNQTVAVVSNNNSATDNVYEKLQKYGLDYLCAQLGKIENKKEFIKNQTGKYPKFEDELENKQEVENEIIKLNEDVISIFSLKNDIAKLKEELSQIEVEHIYFNNQEGKNIGDLPKIRNINKVSSDIIMLLKVECEELEANKRKIDFWFKLKSILLYGIGNRKFYDNDIKNLVKVYSKLYFIIREIEIKNKIRDCNKKLINLGNDNKLELLTKNSMKLFKDFLGKKYRGEERKIFNIEELYRNPDKFNREYPIILSTTHSIKNCLKSDYKFDYIIIDEASQVDLITGALALSSARNAIIVGDLKQLPNVITTQDRKLIEEFSERYKIDKPYDYLKNSFLSSVSNALEKAPRTLLREHYRCHPKIIGFCNKKFYDNQLIIMTEDKGEKDVLKAYITVQGNHARGHINQRQIDVIKEEILPEIEEKVKYENIGIISPYRDQKKNLDNTMEENIQIDTVHKFQGREQEAIIITTVDNAISEFIDDSKMLNVAVTRAKRYLRVVVSDNKENEGTNIDDLVKYIQYNNFEIVESKIKSIFDLLYKSNREKRMEYLKSKKRISDYDSENLIYNCIQDVIKENSYDNLDVVVHIPLVHLLKDLDKLENKELQYAKNVWTHVDFVIFNKMDKKMVMAVEVDGYFYHKEGTKQDERDKLKDKILEKYDIPLIRLSTIGKDEKMILNSAMEKIFKKM